MVMRTGLVSLVSDVLQKLSPHCKPVDTIPDPNIELCKIIFNITIDPEFKVGSAYNACVSIVLPIDSWSATWEHILHTVIQCRYHSHSSPITTTAPSKGLNQLWWYLESHQGKILIKETGVNNCSVVFHIS